MKKQGCEIEATGINYTIISSIKTNLPFSLSSSFKLPWRKHCSSTPPPLRVLKNVNCCARSGQILAVVGPSGAGKSSLLQVLAGRMAPETASISVDGEPLHKSNFMKISGYVAQKQTLFPLLTVRETLMFTARLRLKLPADQMELKVDLLLHELGLGQISGSRIGNDDIRGVSGGERRRISIAVDVIHDPRVLILDEPTSGLDSMSALQIVGMLKSMAESCGRTIILSVHQPGFRIVEKFDSILLLSSGSVLFQGTTDLLQNHLSALGLHPPLHVNVVEFAIDSIDLIESKQSQEPSRAPESRSTLQKLFLQQSRFEEVADSPIDSDEFEFANSRLKETIILTQRFTKNIIRTRELFAGRMLQMILASAFLGSVFYNLKDDLTGAEERVGLFAFILTFLLSLTVEALPVFLQEREILMKETSCGSYRVSSYALANAIVYLPFLLIMAVLFSFPLYFLAGLNSTFTAFMDFLLLIWAVLYLANSVVICFSSMVPSFIVGNTVISGVMGSFFLFSGYFISKDEIPEYWKFMHYISIFKYPFESFLINEFGGSEKCLEVMLGGCVLRAGDVVKMEGYGKESRWRNLGIVLCFIFLYRIVAYGVLRLRCSRSAPAIFT